MRVAILSTIYHVINNTVVLLINTWHLFHHARLLHQNLSEDRSLRQLRAATEEFQSWFGPALLAEKVWFLISSPTTRHDLDLNLDHSLASIIMRPSFILTVYWAGSFTPRLRMVRETWPRSPGLLNDSLVALGILCLQTRRHTQTVRSTQWIMWNNMERKQTKHLGGQCLPRRWKCRFL